MKKDDKTPEELKDVEISFLPKKELRAVLIKDDERTQEDSRYAQSKKLEFLNKELGNIKNTQRRRIQ